MVIESNEIEPIKYEGSVGDSGACMDKFLIRGSGVTYL